MRPRLPDVTCVTEYGLAAWEPAVILSSVARRDELRPEMNGGHRIPAGGNEDSPGQAQRSRRMPGSAITRPVGARRNFSILCG
ncbi:MAG: hypothetical protein ABSC48_06590 [Terracidiphilus sp.]